MTELATRPSAWPPAPGWDGTIERHPATVQPTQAERMREWLHLFKECREAAEVLAKTSFVPKDMMGKPAEIAASMLKGWELGLDPLDALASIYVVHGRVGFYAEFMRRRIIQAGHTFRVLESTDSRCIVEGTRQDNGETHRAGFTAEQAKRAKIDIAAYPAEKLVARATSRLCKQAFPDVLSGSLIVEDLLDGLISVDSERLDAPAQEAAEAPALQRRTRTARKAPAPKIEPTPAPATDLDEFPAEPEPEPETQPAPAEPEPAEAEPETENAAEQGITDPQLKKLHVLFGKHGLNERQAGLDWLTAATGREITSSKDLTKREAIKVIDMLENDEPPQEN
ncbi:Uncharacterised protein [Mycobacteroides abscessus subsp. abscessus]|jgi:hypothetical protein|uniref:hypothetical protein n=1 Tax=Mycobacteroides abscessus TaxID=36809 RepID=UPI00092C2AD9|nr:hypothetical protein [Mycobacteroides abscessus]SII86100.1 Uncharacterised protein [Mycobacteroides abscessus subsp. abscessus]SIK03912.1 Uncharacterised protein [Mycobacteroides abscessus subsp. abscessus]SIK07329.1 Uncharacterised protein [Mycobacteroides abscessus subsp. abscessus]SIM06700.1 Uncharacterised protein [Mycobacteroides abscessus subsp. abscessus]SIN56950.1 Uncharacterised protein [Mycobacteroides abscessus subsp. abscessus]